MVPADGQPIDVDTTGEHLVQRAPRQERGRRRVDEIVDATEALVAEVGPSAASIQEIARRAGASVGSIYHFFPTKEAIFDAIRARYDVEARAKAAEILASADAWAPLPLPQFVARMLAPFAEFLERAPVHFELATNAAGQRTPKNAATDAALREALQTVIARRTPELTRAECAWRADVMMAIGEGIASLMAAADGPARRRLVAELERATYGYLATYESQDGRPAA